MEREDGLLKISNQSLKNSLLLNGKPIEIIVPCTTANLGCGFDTLGMALDKVIAFVYLAKLNVSL